MGVAVDQFKGTRSNAPVTLETKQLTTPIAGMGSVTPRRYAPNL
jgi:hypothetical protein